MTLFRCLFAALALTCAILCAGAPNSHAQTQAQTFEQAVARFASDTYNETDAAVAAIAASGHVRAAVVITALSEGRLFAGPDKQILARGKDGALVDAVTGAAVGDPSGLKPVGVQQSRAPRHRRSDGHADAS